MPQRDKASQRRLSLRLLGCWQLVDNGAELRLSHREQRLVALLGLSGERSRPHGAGGARRTDERALASLRRAVMHTQHARPGLLCAGRALVGLDPELEVDVAEVVSPPGSRGSRSPTTSSPTCSRCSAGRSCCPAGTTTGSWPSARASTSCACVPSTGSRGRRWTEATWSSPSTPPGRPRRSSLTRRRPARSPSARTWYGETSPPRSRSSDAIATPRGTTSGSPRRRGSWRSSSPPSGRPTSGRPAVPDTPTRATSAGATSTLTRRRPWPRPLPSRPSRSPRRGNVRVLAALVGAAVLLLVVSLAEAVTGPDRGGSGQEAGARAPASPGSSGRRDGAPGGRSLLDLVAQELSVRPASLVPGVARYVLSASSLPARCPSPSRAPRVPESSGPCG